jgi:hypothetical protein
LATQKRRRKRSKALKFALLPGLFFLFFLGWCLFWIGNREKNKRKTKQPEKDLVTFIPAIYEEAEEIAKD